MVVKAAGAEEDCRRKRRGHRRRRDWRKQRRVVGEVVEAIGVVEAGGRRGGLSKKLCLVEEGRKERTVEAIGGGRGRRWGIWAAGGCTVIPRLLWVALIAKILRAFEYAASYRASSRRLSSLIESTETDSDYRDIFGGLKLIRTTHCSPDYRECCRFLRQKTRLGLPPFPNSTQIVNLEAADSVGE